MKILILSFVFGAFSLYAFGQNKLQKEKAPNVIIIFPDQMRQFSLGFWSKGDNARGLYTGNYTFVVQTSDKVNFEEAYYYNNHTDPYQLHQIKSDEMNLKLVEKWKTELAKQLNAIDDSWAQD